MPVRLRTERLRHRGKEKGALCKRKEPMILCGWSKSRAVERRVEVGRGQALKHSQHHYKDHGLHSEGSGEPLIFPKQEGHKNVQEWKIDWRVRIRDIQAKDFNSGRAFSPKGCFTATFPQVQSWYPAPKPLISQEQFPSWGRGPRSHEKPDTDARPGQYIGDSVALIAFSLLTTLPSSVHSWGHWSSARQVTYPRSQSY